MELKSLHDLYLDQLRDLYSAETQLVKALPEMAKASSAVGLRSAFEQHLDQTRQHVERLQRIFSRLDARPEGKTCKGMQGLIAEGQETIKEKADKEVKDAALIAAAQRVEHYEMAGYGAVRSYAQMMGHTEDANLLQKTLDEEGAADKKLTQLAEQGINLKAQARRSSI